MGLTSILWVQDTKLLSFRRDGREVLWRIHFCVSRHKYFLARIIPLSQILITKIDHPLTEAGSSKLIWLRSAIRFDRQAKVSAEVTGWSSELFLCSKGKFLIADRDGVDVISGVLI